MLLNAYFGHVLTFFNVFLFLFERFLHLWLYASVDPTDKAGASCPLAVRLTVRAWGCIYCTHASASVLVRERSLVLRSNFSRSQYGKKQLVSFRRVVPHSEQLHVVEVGHAGVLRMRAIVAQSPHFVSEIGNKSVPIQLTQCWFPGLAISSAKI